MTDTALIDPWLELLWKRGGSDLILRPTPRHEFGLTGILCVIEDEVPLTPEAIDRVIRSMLPQEVAARFEEQLDADFAFSWEGHAVLRGNAFRQRGGPALALRMIPIQIPTVEDLGLPQTIVDFARLPCGLVLVTGPTGSGKSTTLSCRSQAAATEHERIGSVDDRNGGGVAHPHRHAGRDPHHRKRRQK